MTGSLNMIEERGLGSTRHHGWLVFGLETCGDIIIVEKSVTVVAYETSL